MYKKNFIFYFYKSSYFYFKLLKFVIAFDMIGLFFPRSPFDHVTHLAGTLFGM